MIEEGIITQKMLDNQEIVNGVSCITVHPTFLYEGVWNTLLLLALFLYRKHKKFDGELAMLYVAGYGVGRFWVEALRTDSLMIGPLKISQVVAVICVILAVGVIIYNRRKKDTVKASEEITEEVLEKKTEVAEEK
jgi:phosphatidylglycerol:prolipoprotein diacylglycerol transferase